jgi:hypothetical protein
VARSNNGYLDSSCQARRLGHRTFSFKAPLFRGLRVVVGAIGVKDGELNGADCKRISGL